jgi:hypothetical protein
LSIEYFTHAVQADQATREEFLEQHVPAAKAEAEKMFGVVLGHPAYSLENGAHVARMPAIPQELQAVEQDADEAASEEPDAPKKKGKKANG